MSGLSARITMDTDLNSAPDYGVAGEAKLRAFVEQQTGGRVTRMERQVRWRPAWFVEVERGVGACRAWGVEAKIGPSEDSFCRIRRPIAEAMGQEAGEKWTAAADLQPTTPSPTGSLETLQLHLRGDRGGDVSIFPELRREADVIGVLGEHGINVPRIHGVCIDPPCIVMDAIPGTRDMASAANDAERSAIAREYMSEVAAMHRLPVAPFVAKGVRLPQGAQEIALAGLAAYLPLYERTKSRPEPMLEFVLGWIRRNVPQHRTRAAFIQFDSGQFLFENGKVTGLYDFEFSMIGDPMVDLATMRMRESVEPLSADFSVLCRHYEEFSGEPVDHGVVDFHTLLFATISTMQFTGTVGAPRPGDAHSVYLEFDLALRQVVLLTLSHLMGVTLTAEPAPRERVGDNAAVLAQLADTVARIETPSRIEQSRQDSAAQLIEWLGRADAMGPEMRERDLADVSALLGRRFDEWPAASAALEAHVLRAGPDEDVVLLRLFGAIEGRRLLLYGPTRIGHSAMHVRKPSTR